MSTRSRLWIPRLLCAVLVLSSMALAQWIPLGPDGGDVRSLTFDPRNPDRMFVGTSAGQLYLSTNNGASWRRFAHLGDGNDFVLDNMEIDPQSGTMYVAAWSASIERQDGGLFRSRDNGQTWQSLPDMRGKSIRAMTLAPSDRRIVTIGALDGVFRSQDGGNSWQRISPTNHAEIKNIESIAVDPKDPDIVYAGTWHLAWKTEDGGRNWHPIKKGVVDDSDVFSIIVDYSNPRTVFLSACSGIYKSETAAELFHKIQGIPFSARRTRVLKQDPVNPAVVYAGTTEGLWKTTDAGKTWRRVTAENIIVNDVHVDPRQPARVLIATDRSGVLASNDAGSTFAASNRGFAHRQVSAIVVDRNDPRVLYAGLVNDKEFGGVFRSTNAGAEWRQISNGLNRHDVFALRQAYDGTLLAGTNHGVFMLDRNASEWRPANTVVQEKIVPAPKTSKKSKKPVPPRVELVKSQLIARVAALDATGKKWFVASSAGLFASTDSGKTWRGGPVSGSRDFIAVESGGDRVVTATVNAALMSSDGGASWSALRLPPYVSVIRGVAIAPDSSVWLATREGVVHSTNSGATWDHVLAGLPPRDMKTIIADRNDGRMLAVSAAGELFISTNSGASWTRHESGFAVKTLTTAAGRLVAATAFDGVIVQPETSAAGGHRGGGSASLGSTTN